MLPGYSSRNRHSQVNTPSGSYISSPTDSSRNSIISTPMSNGRGNQVLGSPAPAMSTPVVFSTTGSHTSSDPFRYLVTPPSGRTSGSGLLPPQIPVNMSRPFRFTPSENGFSSGYCQVHKFRIIFRCMFLKFQIIFRRILLTIMMYQIFTKFCRMFLQVSFR